jgi:hypothetical protein
LLKAAAVAAAETALMVSLEALAAEVVVQRKATAVQVHLAKASQVLLGAVLAYKLAAEAADLAQLLQIKMVLTDWAPILLGVLLQLLDKMYRGQFIMQAAVVQALTKAQAAEQQLQVLAVMEAEHLDARLQAQECQQQQQLTQAVVVVDRAETEIHLMEETAARVLSS